MESKTMILLVEDDRNLLEVAEDYLREVGYEVVAANSGQEALQKAKRIHPDIIVSDIMMQNGNGLYLLENLKRHPATHLIPFIFVTARGSRSDIRQGMALGADDYITKPFNMDELEMAIQSQLEKSSRRSSAAVAVDKQHLLSLPHELRTPLNGILGITDLMLDGLKRGRIPGLSELEENIDIVHESGLRLFRLIENYLLYYELRLAAGRADNGEIYRRQSAEVPLSQDFFSDLCSQHKRPNDIRINMTPARLPIGEELFRKLVLELVDNSLKFSDPHEAIYVTGYEERGDYVITIVDHGIGMTAEQIENVGPFTQFDRDALEQQGIGLGLCLVRLITEMLGLNLTIESEPRDGTSIFIRFPGDLPAPA